MSLGIGYLNSMETPPKEGGRIPNTDDVAGLPRKIRRDARPLARFFNEQYTSGLRARRRHALSWIKVSSIMAGVHHFRIKNGVYEAIEKKPGRIRAHIPVMDWMTRWELGRFNSNEIGVRTRPISTFAQDAYYQAERAQAIMEQWREETGLQDFFDEANQYLLWYGTVAYMRYTDVFRGQVRLKPIPGPELFPIPFDARTAEEADGFMRVTNVSKQWLEMQDELHERKYGKKPERPMAKAATGLSTNMSANSAGFATSSDRSQHGRMDGATVKWIWMKPSETEPYGCHAFMVEDDLYRYVSGKDADGRLLAFPSGDLPLEFVHYDKHPDSFWASGFCEKLIAMQREVNRQWTEVIKSAEHNKGYTGYRKGAVQPTDIQDAVDGLVPFEDDGESRIPPIMRIAPNSVGRDVAAVLEHAMAAAERAACYESGIPFGRQEGRTEGGPATNLLDANSKAAVQPVFNRIHRAFKRTFPAVLDDLREVWPAQKVVRVTGRQNVGREILIRREEMPWSHQVIMVPTPIQANGRNEQMNLLYSLRQLPSQDGKGFMLADREFRTGLEAINMDPPGMETENRPESRLTYRIARLTGDGQTPQIQPGTGEQQFEDHRLAVDMLRNVILDPAATTYGPAVKQALMTELQFHLGYLSQEGPAIFDDDMEEADMQQTENDLEARELDPDSLEGVLSLHGSPIGV